MYGIAFISQKNKRWVSFKRTCFFLVIFETQIWKCNNWKNSSVTHWGKHTLPIFTHLLSGCGMSTHISQLVLLSVPLPGLFLFSHALSWLWSYLCDLWIGPCICLLLFRVCASEGRSAPLSRPHLSYSEHTIFPLWETMSSCVCISQWQDCAHWACI